MAQFEKWFTQDLTKDVPDRHCESVTFTGDNLANVIGVNLFVDGEPYSGGGTVAGTVIRADGITVPVNGTLDGNSASITLTDHCLSVPGIITVNMKLIDTTERATILHASFTAVMTETRTAVDPEEIIPDLATLQAAADKATAAAADARAAASSAVRYDTAQSLTDAQQEQARENIGAASQADKTATLDGSGHVDWGWVPGEQTATVAGVTVTRNGNRVKLNGVSTGNFFVRMVGDLLVRTSSPTAAQVIAGCPTIAGHEYQYQMRRVSGSAAFNTAHSNAFLLSAAAYKAGSNTAFDNHHAQRIEEEGWALRDFTSDDGADLSVWLWCATGATFSNAEYELTLLDVTAAEQTDLATTMAKAALSAELGALPVEAYGRPGSVQTANRVRVSKGWGNRVRVDAVGSSGTAMVSIQNGVTLSNGYWTPTNDMVEYELDAGHTYRLTARYISGTVTQVGTVDTILAWMRKRESDSAPLVPSFTEHMIADINNGITEWNVIWTSDEPTKIGFGFYFRSLTADALIIEFLCEDVTDSNNIAPADKSTAASTHTAGSLLTVNGTLYKATQAIVAGETITPGTNVTETTVAEQLAERDTAIAAETAARENQDTLISDTLRRLSLTPFERSLFTLCQRDITVNTSSNHRVADLVYNAIYSEGEDRGGTTFRTVWLTGSDTSVGANITSGSLTTIPRDRFSHFVSDASNNKLIVTAHRVTYYDHSFSNASNNPPVFYFLTYDPDTGVIYWKDYPVAVGGHCDVEFGLSQCVAYGNIGIAVLFRRPTQTIDWQFNARLVSPTYSPYTDGIPEQTLVNSGKIIDTDATT